MLLIYWSLHQLLVQLMRSLDPEQGWEEYPGPGSACCPCQTAPTMGTQFKSTPKPHHATFPHWSIPFRNAPAETGIVVSGQREMGTDPVPNPTTLKRRDFFASTLLSSWRSQGQVWDPQSGRVLSVEEPKTSEGWELLQQSHTSLTEVTTEQRSFALIGDLWLCPKRVPLRTSGQTLLL